jgi:hypothetical protein
MPLKAQPAQHGRGLGERLADQADQVGQPDRPRGRGPAAGGRGLAFSRLDSSRPATSSTATAATTSATVASRPDNARTLVPAGVGACDLPDCPMPRPLVAGGFCLLPGSAAWSVASHARPHQAVGRGRPWGPADRAPGVADGGRVGDAEQPGELERVAGGGLHDSRRGGAPRVHESQRGYTVPDERAGITTNDQESHGGPRACCIGRLSRGNARAGISNAPANSRLLQHVRALIPARTSPPGFAI